MTLLVAGYGRIAEEAWSEHIRRGGVLARAFGKVCVAEPCPSARLRARRWVESDHVVGDIVTACNAFHCDSALVLTPPSISVKIVEQLLELGVRRLLVEKPFTLNPDELDSVDRLAERNSASISVVQNYLYRPDFAFTISAIRDGVVGNLLGGELSTVDCAPWAGWGAEVDWRVKASSNPQGVLGDKGYHLLYIVDALTRGCSLEHRLTDDRCEWRAAACRESVRWTLRASWRAREGEGDHFTFRGDKGSISILGTDLGKITIRSLGLEGCSELRVSGDDWWGYRGMISDFILGTSESWRRHIDVASMISGGC